MEEVVYTPDVKQFYRDGFIPGKKKKVLLEEKDIDENYAEFEFGKIYDKDVAEFVKQHLSFKDRFDLRKVVEATMIGFTMLVNNDIPEGNWLFF